MAMTRLQRHVAATAGELFAILADGWLYPSWMVGASRIRAVDGTWPAPGARLHYSYGAWPLLVDDDTELLQWEPDKKAVLQATCWPMRQATIALTPEADDASGCHLNMVAEANKGAGRLMPNVVKHALMVRYNTESLQRLAFQAERRSGNW